MNRKMIGSISVLLVILIFILEILYYIIPSMEVQMILRAVSITSICILIAEGITALIDWKDTRKEKDV